MKNNVAGGSFHLRHTKKLFSIFRVPKKGYFVKQPPNEVSQWYQPIFQNTRPPYLHNFPTRVSETFPSTPREKDKFLPNQ
jgi:hypothetical protein